MGDKLAAKETMVDAEVPTLPSIEVTDSTDIGAVGQEIGFPLLVKASAGGGGKGMRVVDNEADLEDVISGAKREALGAFGNDTVFLERYLPTPRHVEIQARRSARHRIALLRTRMLDPAPAPKIIEEAPSPVLSEDLRDQMGQAAVAAVQAIGYESAGTVEFYSMEAATKQNFSSLRSTLDCKSNTQSQRQ